MGRGNCEKCGLGEEENTLSHFTESSEMLCIITQKCKAQNIIFPTQLLYLHFLLAIFMKVLSRLGQRLLMMDYFSWYLSFMISSTQLPSFFGLGLGLKGGNRLTSIFPVQNSFSHVALSSQHSFPLHGPNSNKPSRIN